jgi:hypothetical protein
MPRYTAIKQVINGDFYQMIFHIAPQFDRFIGVMSKKASGKNNRQKTEKCRVDAAQYPGDKLSLRDTQV